MEKLAVFAIVQYIRNVDKRAAKADYLWKTENYPQMTEWYEQEEYDMLVEFYRKALEEDQPVWGWDHSGFCMIYDNIQDVQERLEWEEKGEEKFQQLLKNFR